jgi:hypothetical protein
MACAEPGAAGVRSTPNWIELPEPVGVNWTRRKLSPPGAVDAGNRDDDDLKLHIEIRNADAFRLKRRFPPS